MSLTNTVNPDVGGSVAVSKSKSFVSTCLSCDCSYNYKISPNNNIELLQTKVKVFKLCSTYLNVETDSICDSLTWNFAVEPLPFCARCFLKAHKISNLHERIAALELEIDNLVSFLKNAIFKSYYINNDASSDTRNEHDILRAKILNYRKLVVQGATDNQTHPMTQANEKIESTTIYPEVYEDQSNDGDDIDIDVKYEPWTPSRFSNDDNILNVEGWSEDDYDDLSVHNETRYCSETIVPTTERNGRRVGRPRKISLKNNSEDNMNDAKQGCKGGNSSLLINCEETGTSMSLRKRAESARGNPNTSPGATNIDTPKKESSNNISRLLNLNNMNTRKLFVKLERVSLLRNGKWHAPDAKFSKCVGPQKSESGKTRISDRGKIVSEKSTKGRAKTEPFDKTRQSLEVGTTVNKCPSLCKSKRPSSALVYNADGRIFCGDVELLKSDDGRESCGACHKLYNRRSSLLSHIKIIHLDLKLKKHKLKGGSSRNRTKSTADGKVLWSGVEIYNVPSGETGCGSCKQLFANQKFAIKHIRLDHADEMQIFNLRRKIDSFRSLKKFGAHYSENELLAAEANVKELLKKESNKEKDAHNNEKHSANQSNHYKNDTAPLKLNKVLSKDVEQEQNTTETNEFESTDLRVTECTSEAAIQSNIGNSNPHKKVRSTRNKSCKNKVDVESEDIQKSTSTISRLSCLRRHKRSKSKGGVSKKIRRRTPITQNSNGRIFCYDIEMLCEEGDKFKCGKCEKMCPNKHALVRHIKVVHKGLKEKYHEKVSVAPALHHKMKETEDGKKFYADVECIFKAEDKVECGKCFRSCNNLENLKTHIRKMHADRRIFRLPPNQLQGSQKGKKITMTPKIGKAVVTSDGFSFEGVNAVKLEDGNFQCNFKNGDGNLCNFIFLTSYLMIDHIRKRHLKDVFDQLPNPEKNPDKIKRKTITTSDGRKIYGGVEMVKMDTGKLQCGKCRRIFNRMSCIMGHIIRHHTDDSGFFACKYCGQRCGAKFILIAHEAKHMEARNHICEVCGLAFKHSGSLNNHKLQKHVGKVRHKCDICSKEFYVTRDFTLHQRKHTGEMPFQCEKCGKRFYTEYLMKLHEKAHHAEITDEEQVEKKGTKRSGRKRKSTRSTGKGDFECDSCDMSFASSRAVKRHEDEEHGKIRDTETNGDVSENEELCVANAPQFDFNVKYPSTLTRDHNQQSFSMPLLENMSSTFNNSVVYNNLDSLSSCNAPPQLTPMFSHKTSTRSYKSDKF